ncbi:ECF-type sigma factor [Planctomicrobium sp.]|nr:sigma factor [Planctomicrobium sp.]MDB4733044.1 ECF-type sigma factor [Planctomicrobium sp.]MDB4743658.1 ECF-type sigma factor [Planctomicrobium sp.]
MSVDLPNEELIQLIVLAKNGDEDALGKLLDQHRDQLRRLAESELSQKLSKRVDASDVVQQTYLSVCKKVEQFQGENIEEFVAWVFQIHRHNIKVRHDNMSQLQNEM